MEMVIKNKQSRCVQPFFTKLSENRKNTNFNYVCHPLTLTSPAITSLQDFGGRSETGSPEKAV